MKAMFTIQFIKTISKIQKDNYKLNDTEKLGDHYVMTLSNLNGLKAFRKYKNSHSVRNKIAPDLVRPKPIRGIYITPFGKYNSTTDAAKHSLVSTTTIRFRCHNLDSVITEHQMARSADLTENVIGKTYRDIGYGFIQHVVLE